jgi:hypothetical protein
LLKNGSNANFKIAFNDTAIFTKYSAMRGVMIDFFSSLKYFTENRSILRKMEGGGYGILMG